MNPNLDAWYGSHSVIRRLWAIKEPQGLRIVVALEPTHDGDDTHPAWLANRQTWLHELQSHTGSPVRLERIDAAVFDELELNRESVVLAALGWRDPTLI
jgi:hypothetical protein